MGRLLTWTKRRPSPIFLTELSIKIKFIQSILAFSLPWQFLYHLSKRKIDVRGYIEYSFSVFDGFAGYSQVGSISGVPPSSNLVDTLSNVIVFNKETGERIQFSENNQFRAPAPGQKEIWIIAGRIPSELYRNVKENMIRIQDVICTFTTDLDETVVELPIRWGEAMTPDFKNEIEQYFTN